MRRLVATAALSATLLGMLLVTATDATTFRVYTAQLGATHGTATLTINTNETARLVISAKALARGTWSSYLYRGTCAALSSKVVTLSSAIVGSAATLSRSASLTVAQVRLLERHAAVVRLVSGRNVVCGSLSSSIAAVPVATPSPTPSPSPSPTPTGSAGTGIWQVDPVKVDPVTDKKTAVSSVWDSTGTVLLVMRCNNAGATELFIAWGQLLTQDTSIFTWSVTARIGTSQAVTSDWDLSTSAKATFYPGDAIAYIKSLYGQSTFVARTTPALANPVTASFLIAGVEGAAATIRDTCAWPA